MVCDYRALNRITNPESTALPLIKEALDQVVGAKHFCQIDPIEGYYPLPIKEED